MNSLEKNKDMTREEALKYINIQARGQLDSETDDLANLANSAAILFWGLDNLNWVGYYIVRGERLVLGPFQGRPACTSIDYGRGVCGRAWKEERPILVEDVRKFQDHIVCDKESRSELVVPIFKEGRVVGVLDLDSPKLGNFSSLDQEYLKKFLELIEEKIDFSKL